MTQLTQSGWKLNEITGHLLVHSLVGSLVWPHSLLSRLLCTTCFACCTHSSAHLQAHFRAQNKHRCLFIVNVNFIQDKKEKCDAIYQRTSAAAQTMAEAKRTGTFQNHSKSLSNCKQASYVDANKFISKDGANKGFYEIALSFLGNSLQAAISSLHIAAPGQ